MPKVQSITLKGSFIRGGSWSYILDLTLRALVLENGLDIPHNVNYIFHLLQISSDYKGSGSKGDVEQTEGMGGISIWKHHYFRIIRKKL